MPAYRHVRFGCLHCFVDGAIGFAQAVCHGRHDHSGRQFVTTQTSSIEQSGYRTWHPFIRACHRCVLLRRHCFALSCCGRRSTPVTCLTSVIESNGSPSFSCARRIASASGPLVKQYALPSATLT